MTQSIAPAALTAILAKHGSASLVADILAEIDRASAIEKKGSNVENRKAAIRKDLKESNAVALAKVEQALEELLPAGAELAQESEQIMAVGLTTEQALSAMKSYVSGKLVAEAQASIQDLVRTLVFQSMNLAAAEQGEEFPEHTNMVLDVPEVGKRFCREGAGRKDVDFDFDALRDIVGTELFDQITTPVVSYKINDIAMSQAILAQPELMERIRDAIVVGGWKSPRLMVRDIPANEKE